MRTSSKEEAAGWSYMQSLTKEAVGVVVVGKGMSMTCSWSYQRSFSASDGRLPTKQAVTTTVNVIVVVHGATAEALIFGLFWLPRWRGQQPPTTKWWPRVPLCWIYLYHCWERALHSSCMQMMKKILHVGTCKPSLILVLLLCFCFLSVWVCTVFAGVVMLKKKDRNSF